MKLILNIILLFSVSIAFSQKGEKPKNLPKTDTRPFRFGFTLGINSMDFKIKQSSAFLTLDSMDTIENDRQMGFNISMISSARLGENFDIRFLPGLIFGQRDLSYSYWSASRGRFEKKTMKIESTFIDFPLLLKYRAKRINNYRPYIVAGTNFSLDLASQKTIKDEEKPKIRLKPFDIYYQFGFGIDYYLTYFKFSTEIKLAIGIMDVLKPDDTKYTTAIEKLSSKLVIICFHFE